MSETLFCLQVRIQARTTGGRVQREGPMTATLREDGKPLVPGMIDTLYNEGGCECEMNDWVGFIFVMIFLFSMSPWSSAA